MYRDFLAITNKYPVSPSYQTKCLEVVKTSDRRWKSWHSWHAAEVQQLPGGLSEGENIKESRQQDQLHQGYRNVAERWNILDAGRTILHQMVFWSWDACHNRNIARRVGFCGNWQKDTDCIRLCHQPVYKARPQTVRRTVLELYQNLWQQKEQRTDRIHHQNVVSHKLTP